MHSKKCTNCGNENDPLLTNCLFCKSPLPVIDLDSISNETLVMNAGEWIGKLKEGTYSITTKDYNAWTGKGFIRVTKAEIQGYALRYLTLIQIRAISNSNILSIYNSLKVEYDIGVASDDSVIKVRKNTKKILVGYAIFFIIIIIAGIVFAVIDKGK